MQERSEPGRRATTGPVAGFYEGRLLRKFKKLKNDILEMALDK